LNQALSAFLFKQIDLLLYLTDKNATIELIDYYKKDQYKKDSFYHIPLHLEYRLYRITTLPILSWQQ